MSRLSTMCGLGMLCLAFLVGAGSSQDAKKEGDKKTTGKVKGMLPAGFKDLKLSKDQITRIYTIQTDYKAKIADLDKQIKELKKKESQDVFKVLSDEQRDQYLKSKGVDTKKTNK